MASLVRRAREADDRMSRLWQKVRSRWHPWTPQLNVDIDLLLKFFVALTALLDVTFWLQRDTQNHGNLLGWTTGSILFMLPFLNIASLATLAVLIYDRKEEAH